MSNEAPEASSGNNSGCGICRSSCACPMSRFLPFSGLTDLIARSLHSYPLLKSIPAGLAGRNRLVVEAAEQAQGGAVAGVGVTTLGHGAVAAAQEEILHGTASPSHLCPGHDK